MNSVIILGASARAASESAVRAGFQVHALDLFADQDLRAIAKTDKIEPTYPGSAVALAEKLPPSSWLFTGGIENYPDVLRQISKTHRLLGIQPDNIARVRTPQLLQKSIKRTSFRFPEITNRTLTSAEHGEWLAKPNDSCGGTHVQFATPDSDRRDGCIQRFIKGDSYSAAFISDGKRCQLLGVTRQWLAKDSSAHEVKSQRSPFAYVGSTGPCRQTEESFDWAELGQQLTTDFQLAGLFGVDAIISEQHEPYIVEINPRYTASMELLEPTLTEPVIQLHASAFAGELTTELRRDSFKTTYGKAYLFAIEPCTFRRQTNDAVSRLPPICGWRGRVADLPSIGTAFEANEPIITLFAANESHVEVQRTLGLTGESGWLKQVARMLN